MNEFKINLEAEQLSGVSNETGISALLNELFKPASKNFDKLKYEIQREFKAGGSPDITRMNFDRVHFDNVTRKGSFRVVLDINFTFGCEDILTKKEGQTSEWLFFIADDAIIFQGSPYVDSRSTADEF